MLLTRSKIQREIGIQNETIQFILEFSVVKKQKKSSKFDSALPR